MLLKPQDIATFLFCPYLWRQNREVLSSSFSFFESSVIEAIILAEQENIINPSNLVPRKIIKQWDNIWWPNLKTHNITYEEGKKLAIKATEYFTEYCKYEISDFLFPTVGVKISSDIKSNQNIIHCIADIIKIDLSVSKRNIHLVGFNNKNLSAHEIAIDPIIKTIVYAFFDNKETSIAYSYIFLQEQCKLAITTVYFRQEDILDMYKMIKFAEYGINTKVNYMNSYNCDRCKQCKSSKF